MCNNYPGSLKSRSPIQATTHWALLCIYKILHQFPISIEYAYSNDAIVKGEYTDTQSTEIALRF